MKFTDTEYRRSNSSINFVSWAIQSWRVGGLVWVKGGTPKSLTDINSWTGLSFRSEVLTIRLIIVLKLHFDLFAFAWIGRSCLNQKILLRDIVVVCLYRCFGSIDFLGPRGVSGPGFFGGVGGWVFRLLSDLYSLGLSCYNFVKSEIEFHENAAGPAWTERRFRVVQLVHSFEGYRGSLLVPLFWLRWLSWTSKPFWAWILLEEQVVESSVLALGLPAVVE